MAKPLLDVHCITEDGCEYPVAVRIAMDDGSVQTYGLECKSELQFQKVMDTLNISIGYLHKPVRKRRNRIHRWHDGHG